MEFRTQWGDKKSVKLWFLLNLVDFFFGAFKLLMWCVCVCVLKSEATNPSELCLGSCEGRRPEGSKRKHLEGIVSLWWEMLTYAWLRIGKRM